MYRKKTAYYADTSDEYCCLRRESGLRRVRIVSRKTRSDTGDASGLKGLDD